MLSLLRHIVFNYKIGKFFIKMMLNKKINIWHFPDQDKVATKDEGMNELTKIRTWNLKYFCAYKYERKS